MVSQGEVKGPIILSVFRLMLLVTVVSLPSTVSTRSLMTLVKCFSETDGDDAAVLLMA